MRKCQQIFDIIKKGVVTTMQKTSDAIYIAAIDSSEKDKQYADYICDGINDQETIQKAIHTLSVKIQNEIRGRRIILLAGNYYISDFSQENECGKVAIMFDSVTNSFEHIGILISGSEHTESTCIHITQECYDKMDENISYSLFSCKAHNWNHHVFKDLYVTVPDNQKKIICFDGRLMGAMGASRCKCICKTKGDYGRISKKIPTEDFIAFMGTYGSNNMWQEKWEFCQAEGFGQGFAVGSEHLLMHKCAALFGLYGFTFNNYPRHKNFDAAIHPITLLACIDEANANLWKFGKSIYKQCINAYNTSFELIPMWFNIGGNYATEVNPGDYMGHIDYVINNGYYNANSVSIQFWENGSGKNFDTINNTHKRICTTKERRSYAANIGQELFDTDLNKRLTYIDLNTWVDAFGNTVD